MNAMIGSWLLWVCLLSVYAGVGLADPLKVVAAENFYGDIARQIGSDEVAMTDILSNPNQDPHLFEASPSVARALAEAELVIYSGADYDPWIDKLLSGSKSSERHVINVADLTGHKSGDNPHIWYDPKTMIHLAQELAEFFKQHDPAHGNDYDQRLQRFLNDMQPLEQLVTDLHSRYQGVPVTATEPVFGYMANALGLEMRNEGFQLAMMNDTEPSPSQVSGFEDDLRGRKVRALIYNSQVTDETTDHLRALAKSASIPVVGVSETEPAGKSYQQWMLDQLHSLAQALGLPRK